MYKITTPGGVEYSPPDGKCWKNIESVYLHQVSEGRFWFGQDGKGVPRRKTYLSERSGKNMWTWWPNTEVGHTQEATQEVKSIFGLDAPMFDFPKPIRLIKRMLQISTNTEGEEIVLDFFSGSATTAHAVMQLNAEDGGNRRFIMVQLPEVTNEKSESYKAGFKNICEIGKERIRRAGKKLTDNIDNNQLRENTMFRTSVIDNLEKESNSRLKENGDIYETIGLSTMADAQKAWLDEEKTELAIQSNIEKGIDIGFRVFKLDTSNLHAWDGTPISDGNIQTLWDRFDAREKTIKCDRSDFDIVFEVMLKMGIHLDYVVSEIIVGERKCYSIGERPFETSKDCMILVCLDFGITPEDVTAFCDLAPAKIIAAEEAFEDSTTMSNAHYILKDRDIEMKLL